MLNEYLQGSCYPARRPAFTFSLLDELELEFLNAMLRFEVLAYGVACFGVMCRILDSDGEVER